MTADALAWSRLYASARWHVFPVEPRGKRPLQGLEHGQKHATDDDAVIERWFSNGAGDRNVGIACGPSGLVVIDADTPKEKNGWIDGRAELADLVAKLGPLPSTPTADTGSGGVHMLFRAPAGVAIVGHLGRSIDVKREGYIVAPPSVHENGTAYRWRDGLAPDEVALAELPAAWLDRMRRRPPPAATSRDPGCSDERRVRRARAYLATMPPAIAGSRGHDALWAATCRAMHGFDLDDTTTRELLIADYNPRCDPPWSDREIDHKIRQARDQADVGRWRVDDREPERDPSTHDRNGERIEKTAGSAESPARSPWILPLDAFLGDREPSDDDREDWNVRDVVPRGEATLLAGPPKCGKTWAMLDLGIAAALGDPWLTHENCVGAPVRVLVLAFEDGLRRLRKRVWELCRRRGLTPNDATLREHLAISREPLRLPGQETEFAAELRAWKPEIVLIDNLTRVMVGDPNATKDAARFGNLWTKLCTDVGASVVFLHHTAKIGPVAFNKRGDGDPFELVKGNGDFVAVARHVVLMRPIDAPDEKLSDVRMRGNLDLRRESFVLGFDRAERGGKWSAGLSDLGDGDEVRARLASERKAKAEADKKADLAAEFERRRTLALEVMRREGACSTRRLADALGLKSPRSVQSVFDALVTADVARRDGNRGYVLVDAEVRSEGAQ